MDKIFSLFKSKKKTPKSEVKNIEFNENIAINDKKQNDNNESKQKNEIIAIPETIKSNNSENSRNSNSNSNSMIMSMNSINSNSKEKDSNVKASNVVEINTLKSNTKLNGFYYNKYIDKVKHLTPSNPILISNENINNQLDMTVYEELYTNLNKIYTTCSSHIETKQENVESEIKSTFELLNLMNLIYCDGNFSKHVNDDGEKSQIIGKINDLEKIIEKIELELDSLENDFNTIMHS